MHSQYPKLYRKIESVDEKPFKMEMEYPADGEWFWKCTPQQRDDVITTITTTNSKGHEFQWIDGSNL